MYLPVNTSTGIVLIKGTVYTLLIKMLVTFLDFLGRGDSNDLCLCYVIQPHLNGLDIILIYPRRNLK